MVSATTPLVDPQQRQDLQMLAGLRPDALGQRHHQQRGVDPAGARQHGVHEPLMPRHVDEPEVTGVGVPQVDGDAATLFLGQAIGIDAGQGFDQRRFAVVHMAGGADDHQKVRFARPAIREPLAALMSSRERCQARTNGLGASRDHPASETIRSSPNEARSSANGSTAMSFA